MSEISPAGWCASAQATNATASATRAAPAMGQTHVVCGVDASFSTAPASPVLLQIKDGASVIWEAYVGSQSYVREFVRGLYITPGNACSAVLAAGGTGVVVGSVNLDGITI